MAAKRTASQAVTPSVPGMAPREHALVRSLAQPPPAPEVSEQLTRSAVRTLALLYAGENVAEKPLPTAQPLVDRLLPQARALSEPPPDADDIEALVDAIISDLT